MHMDIHTYTYTYIHTYRQMHIYTPALLCARSSQTVLLFQYHHPTQMFQYSDVILMRASDRC